MNEEEAYKKHVEFIEKETGLTKETIKKVLEADEKYLDIIIKNMEGKNND